MTKLKCKLTGKTKTLVEGHLAKPVKPINETKSRFAYKLKTSKGKKFLKGLWELDSANISKRTFTYKEVKC